MPKRYSVTGTVTYKGAPIEKGTIAFKPVDETNNRSATGVIENGEYYLTTADRWRRRHPRQVPSHVSPREADFSKAEANIQGGAMRQDDVAAAYTDAKKLIPAKYELPETSGLESRSLEELQYGQL